MQELFVNKIQIFKFLSISDKPWIDQLKIIAAARAVMVQVSLNLSIDTKKGKQPVLRTNTKP